MGDVTGEALRQAAGDGNAEEVGRILEEAPGLINTRDRTPSQWTPLMTASYRGHVDVVRLLVDHGASMDLRDSEGGTALYLAADRRRVDVVSLLLAKGANASLKAMGGLNALMAASFGGHVEVVRRLLLLMREGEEREVDERSAYGQTALWWACANGCAEVAKTLLVEGGASHLITDYRQGLTPGQVAKSRDKHACVDVMTWYEQQIGLPYTLHKARCLQEARVMKERYPTATLPRYLHKRATAGITDLPRVEVMGGGGGGDDNEGSGGGGDEEEEERDAVIGFVMEGLNHELYIELMEGLRLPS